MLHTSYSKRPSSGHKVCSRNNQTIPAPLARPPPPVKPSPVFRYALPQSFHIIETVRAADVVDQHKGVRVLQAPVFRVRPLLRVEAGAYSRPSYSSSSFPITYQQHSGHTFPQARFPSPVWILSVLNSPTYWASHQTTIHPTYAPTTADTVTACPSAAVRVKPSGLNACCSFPHALFLQLLLPELHLASQVLLKCQLLWEALKCIQRQRLGV